MMCAQKTKNDMGHAKLLLTIGLVFVTATSSSCQDICTDESELRNNTFCMVTDKLLDKDSAMRYEIKPILWKNVHRSIGDVESDADICADYLNCWTCDLASYRLPKTIVPVNYIIRLIPYVEAETFTFDGDTLVTIKILCATRHISLHSRSLTINETATTLKNTDRNIIYKPWKYHYHNKTHVLIIHFDDELIVGNYILHMKFSGISPKNTIDGLRRIAYANEYDGVQMWIVVTFLDPIYARNVFPCWDEPAFKAIFKIHIKHTNAYEPMSNMPLHLSIGFGLDIWSHFKHTPSMSTYLVAFALLPNFLFRNNEDATINVRARFPLTTQAIFMRDIVEKSISLLSHYTGVGTNVPKIDHLVVPDYSSSGMENWGLVMYKESNVDYDKESDTPLKEFHMALIVTHEVAHTWFGNLVTPFWWSHMWLKEGLTTFFSYYILDQIDTMQGWDVKNHIVIFLLHFSFNIDTGSMPAIVTEVNTETEIISLLSHSSYKKAPIVVRMLQHIVTERLFQNSITRYIQTYQFSTATSDDFWTIVQTALDESNVPHSGYKIKEVMDTWMKQKRFPLITVTRNYETGETYIEQKVFRLENIHDIFIDEAKWWVPITFTTQANPDFSNTVPKYWLRPMDFYIRFETDPNDWIIVNLQQTGYYRVNYDVTNWQKIANYLNSEDYREIHVLNRAQIIDDVCALFMAKYIDFELFKKITIYLRNERNNIPWYPMFQIISQLEKYFPLPESEPFKMHMAKILTGLLEWMGYDEHPRHRGPDKLLRTDAVKWACKINMTECERQATIKLTEHLENPKTHKFYPLWEQWTFCNGLSNMNIWNKALDVFKQEQDSKYLRYMACSKDDSIIIKYMYIYKEYFNANYSIEKQGVHHHPSFTYIVQNHAQKDKVFYFILQNFKSLELSSLKDIEQPLTQIIFNVYTWEKLDKIEQFLKNYEFLHEFTTTKSNALIALQGSIETRRIELQYLKGNYSELFTTQDNQT